MVSGLHAHILVGIWKSRKWKWKQKWKTEMETCTVVSNHWTGFGLSQTTSFGVGQKLNMLIQPINCSWAGSGSFLE